MSRRVVFFAQTYAKAFGVMLLSFLLVACGKGTGEIHKYIAKTKEIPPRPIKPLPEYKPVPGYQYSASDKRSPFQRKMNSTDDLQPDVNRPKEPLEAFSLDSLKLVGTFKKEETLWALISAPDGNVYPITKGNYLGQNYGKVLSINEKELKIEEKIQTSDGWKTRTTVLQILSA